jgi:nitrogen regulatory protein PII
MKKYKQKIITIITESILEHILEEELETLGAHGFTITNARGKGDHGLREGFWETEGNIRIEVVCDEETSEKICEHLYANYYENYGMMLYIHTVEVLRDKKF